jgi:hypothetical protein
MKTGLFLCQECAMKYENDPNAPDASTYTLQLVDNAKDLKLAMDNLRRVNVQLSSKFIGSQQIRPGIYDLLQKVRGKGKAPITSNLPSENFALGIGSKRLAGTGRTAGIKAKKLEQQGVAASAAQAKNYLVSGGIHRRDNEDFLFLKNALGYEVQFTVERGGGARAQLLASKRRRRRKLMDAAASRVGANLPLHLRVQEARKRKIDEEGKKAAENSALAKKKLMREGTTLEFLKDNIGRGVAADEFAISIHDISPDDDEGAESTLVHQHSNNHAIVLVDDMEEFALLSEEARRAAFQAQYKLEVERQAKLLQLEENTTSMGSPLHSIMSAEDEPIQWEDGDKL